MNLFTAIKNMRDSTSDSRNTGARCLRVSPDGQTLATGDRSGNVRFVCFSVHCRYDLYFVKFLKSSYLNH